MRGLGAAPEAVLVRIPNWLGDALMARPALHALRRARPDASITACGPAALLGLLAPDGTWDAAEPWPLAPGALARLRGRHFAGALVLPPSFSSAWFAWRTGARRRIGFAHEARSPLLTRALARPARGDLHLAREYLALAAELGAVAGETPPLAVSERAAAQALALAFPEPGARRPFVLLAPGAAYGPAKRWSAGRFAGVAQEFLNRGRAVLVCGTAREAPACEEVARLAGTGVRSLAGATDLEVQAALCGLAEVVVSNDSGMAHLAGAVGAPTVAVFGSTSSAWTAPLGPRVRIVQRPPVCSPCFARTCRIGYICLTAVTSEDVVAAAAVACASGRSA